jgi:hypothetical protein
MYQMRGSSKAQPAFTHQEPCPWLHGIPHPCPSSRYSHIFDRGVSRQCTRSNSSTIWSENSEYRVRVTKNSISIIISTTASMWPPCVCTPHTYGCPNAIPDRDPPDEMSDLAGFACHTGQLRECFGCRWRGGEAVDRTITGAFGIVTELLVVLQPLSQHDLTLQVQRMAGALRRTDWSSTPHPTPRDAPPESVCCLVSVTVMRASLGTVNTCLS